VRKNNVSRLQLPDFPLWKKMDGKNILIDMELEITARCNNNCRHCYINLPAGDRKAMGRELKASEITGIALEGVKMGAMSCLITGGEPLLRKDFPEIYLSLKKMGLLVSVFTNAVLVEKEHVDLFCNYPPRDIEVSVYGATRETYEKVTRKPGSFDSFTRGLKMLLDNGIKVRFKAVAMRSNLHEMPLIAAFCRERTKDYFRFDPMLNLRFDGNRVRNREIMEERLLPEEIAELEKSDPERIGSLKKDCEMLITKTAPENTGKLIFGCGAGKGACTVGWDGTFRLCSSLCHPDCIYNLKQGSLGDAYKNFVPRVRRMASENREFLENCGRCRIVNLCMWCPAVSYLETGKLDEPVDYFCRIAGAREEMLKQDL